MGESQVETEGLHFGYGSGPAVLRGIEFTAFSSCSPLKVSKPFCEDFEFGGNFNFPGHARGSIKIPKGQYVCITARDALHTLRASAIMG